MKRFIILALCLSAVVAEELHDRGVDFHTLHYSQHHQSLEEAKQKVSDVLGGQHAEFEEVGSYGGYGGYGGNVGVGTVGLSSAGLSGSEFGSSSGGSSQFSSSAASNYGASHSANLASSSSYGSNANFASGSYGSASHQSGSRGSSSGSFTGSGSNSYSESSGLENVQRAVSEGAYTSGVGSHDSYSRHEEHISDSQVATPLVYNVPSGGSEKYYFNQERRVSSSANPYVYVAPTTGGSENYVHHEEHRVQSQAVPTSVVHYSAPSVGSEKIVQIKEEHVQQTPLQIISTPVGGQESYIKYRKVTSTASQPQVVVHTAPSTSSSYVHESSASSSTSGSQLGSLVSGGLSGTNSKYQTGYYGNTGYTVPSSSFGSSALTASNSGFGSSHHDSSNFASSSLFGAGHQAGFGANSAYTDSGSFGSKFGSNSKFGSSFGSESKFGSQFGADSSFSSGSSLGASGAVGTSSGLHNYIQESERLAKLQSQGMSVGTSRASGSQFNANLESDNALGFGGFGGHSGAAGGNGGYKTKSWEKASKWSSQSEFGPDGQVNNYKKLSTGESENYDINGHRAGYQAATTTLDDNGKLSSYSLHT